MFWYNATNGHVRLWKIANGEWAGSASVGLHPTGYQAAASGDFNADGTSDVLWYNPSNGHTDIWKLSNAQWAGSTTIGSHPLGWQLVGAGDFKNDGTSDVLWYNPTTRSRLVEGRQRPVGRQCRHRRASGRLRCRLGIGDFDNDGTDDVSWFNATTGATDIWLIANGRWSASADIGTHPTGWSPAGVGDFNDDGFADVLWRGWPPTAQKRGC